MGRDLAPEGQRWRCPLNGCKFTIKCRWELSSTSRPHCKNSHPGLSSGTYIIQNATLVSEVEGRRLNAEYYRELKEGVQPGGNSLTAPNHISLSSTVMHEPATGVSSLNITTSASANPVKLQSSNNLAFHTLNRLQSPNVNQPLLPPPTVNQLRLPRSGQTQPLNLSKLQTTTVYHPYSFNSESVAVDDMMAPSARQIRQKDLSNCTKKLRCYVCKKLLSTPNVVRTHFGIHKQISEPFQPDRVAAVWCDNTTHKPVELARSPTLVKQFEQKSLAGICVEVRFLILRELLSYPKLSLDARKDWMSYECFSFHDHETLALRTEAKDVLIKSNFLIKLIIHYDINSPYDVSLIRGVLDRRACVIRTDLTGEIEHCDLKINIRTRAKTESGSCSTYEALVAYNESFFEGLCVSFFFCGIKEIISSIGLKFEASSVFPRAGTVVKDVVRYLTYTRQVKKVQIQGLSASMSPAHLVRTMEKQFDRPIDWLKHFSSLIKDAQQLLEQGRYPSAELTLHFGHAIAKLMPDELNDQSPDTEYIGNGSEELRIRYALIRLRTFNHLVEFRPANLKYLLDKTKSMMPAWATISTRSPIVSTQERGEAHTERGRFYRFLGDENVALDHPGNNQQRDGEGVQTGVLELSNVEQHYLEAAKQFYFAAKILKDDQYRSAVGALEEILAQFNWTMDDDSAGFTKQLISADDEWEGDERLLRAWRDAGENFENRFERPKEWKEWDWK